MREPSEATGKALAFAQSLPSQHLAHHLSYILHPAVLMALNVILISRQARNNFALTLMEVVSLIAGLFPGLFYHYIIKS